MLFVLWDQGNQAGRRKDSQPAVQELGTVVSVYKTPGRACSVALPSEQRHIRECAMEGPGPDLSNHHTILQLRASRHSLSQFLVLWGKVLAVSTPASCSTNSHRLSYVYQALSLKLLWTQMAISLNLRLEAVIMVESQH